MNPENPVIQEYGKDNVQNPVIQEGIDISHYQGNIEWSKLTPDASGKQFIIAKATEGATYQDPEFLSYWPNMASNGFQLGAYHVVRVGTGSTPAGQMENLATQLRRADNDWVRNKPIISVNAIEASSKDNYELLGCFVKECVNCLKDDYGVTPYIYTSQDFWDEHVKSTPEIVRECPLWVAMWRVEEPSPKKLPNGWDKWTTWHYSDQGTVPGISGNVDLDKMKIDSKM
ncbi:glycoside hydrolase family 25 protein [Cardinium endosymbiont of Tipula unca]|uniref:glycoside hydrolase family 25 protein n=1 Tax=Cardinium endosymbiont of Tipula unca TaxID=3066216 RepID=UPI0030D29BF6